MPIQHGSSATGVGGLRGVLVIVVLALAVGLGLAVYLTLDDDDVQQPSTPSSRTGGSTDVQLGDSGQDVIQIQTLLRDTWGFQISVDGVYGQQTVAAVGQFQSDHGLPATGVVDDATLAALQAGPEPPDDTTVPETESTAPTPIDGTPVTGPPPTEVVDP